LVKITFGILALNARPLLEYNLRALYPFAHEIIVVEGATRAASSLAQSDGHSADGTFAMLQNLESEMGLENKIQIVTASEDGYTDGFWPEKDEMSRAYAKRATSDWLWQVDSDEFYREEDIAAIITMLESDPGISAVSFPYREFFGSFSVLATGTWHLYEHPRFNRLFRWGKGFTYERHRPPTVLDEKGVDLRNKNWISAPRNGKRAIFLYHYSYVFPKQIKQKVGYYANVGWTDVFRQNARWMQEEYYGLKHPMFLGERGWPVLQWLERYSGQHPAAIQRLRADLVSGKILENMRPTEDIGRLLNSPLYFLERVMGRVFLAIYWPLRVLWKRVRSSLLGGVNVR
jgi:hypothetical protein